MDLESRVRQFGLTVIYESQQGPLVDIVFVHGLNGHPHRTWTSTTSNKAGTFWPVDLLPEVLSQNRVRILTYGYNANVTSFTDGASKDRILNHSETLAAQLAANRRLKRCSERPIIFVCHSLGGLVVKRALIYSRSITNEKVEHLRSIYVSTYGILFLGTPHNGSEVAKWGILLQNICAAVLPKKFMDSSPHLIKALKTNNETLQNINSLFTDMVPRFHIYFFHETLSTDVKGSRELIVDETSAAPYTDGAERMGIEADHSHMCKFDDENAPGYEAVAEALLRYSGDAPATIQERWNEEDRTRMIIRTQKAKEIFGDSVELHSAAETATSAAGRQYRTVVGGNLSGRALPSTDEAFTFKEDEIEEPLDFEPNDTFYRRL
ncbi:Alpha/Beta hydrolase protein [Aspergillus californicus]